jgi:hypothetical protein
VTLALIAGAGGVARLFMLYVDDDKNKNAMLCGDGA